MLCVLQVGCVVFHGADETELIHTSVASSHANSQAEHVFKKGLAQFESGNTERSMSLFERAIALDPTHGRAHNNLGLIQFERRRLAKAANLFHSAIEFLPEDPTPVNNLGMTLEAGGRVDEAIELYRQANMMDPSNPKSLGNLVRLKIRLGEEDELVRQQLMELAMIEHRPQWVRWVQDKLALDLNPMLDRGGMDRSNPDRSNPDNSGDTSKNASGIKQANTMTEPFSNTLPEPVVIPAPFPEDLPFGDMSFGDQP